MAPFLGPVFTPDGPLLVESLDGRKGVPRDRRKRATRVVVDDFGNAVAYERRCPDCLLWLPLDFAHYHPRHDLKAQGMQSRCTACVLPKQRARRRQDPERERELARAGYARRMADPVLRERRRAAEAAYKARRMAEDPEGERARRRELQRQARERRKKNPAAMRRYRETARMDARLRAERAGRTMRSSEKVRERDEVAAGRMPFLPAKPLGDVLEARIQKALAGREYGGVEGSTQPTRETVCQGYGATIRDLLDWKSGRREGVRFDTAERVMIALDLLWFDIWPPEEFPEVAAVFDHDAQAA